MCSWFNAKFGVEPGSKAREDLTFTYKAVRSAYHQQLTTFTMKPTLKHRTISRQLTTEIIAGKYGKTGRIPARLNW